MGTSHSERFMRRRRHPPSVPPDLRTDFENLPKWVWIELYIRDVRLRVPDADIGEILHYAQLRAKDIQDNVK